MATSLVNNKYRITRRIGGGSFGEIYLGVGPSGEKVAVKFEKHGSRCPQLRHEYKVYREVAGCHGFCRVYHFGTQDNYNVMVMDLLGPSLEDLFNKCNRKFSLKTVLQLADQMLERVDTFHSRHLIHRDIKPANFVIGTGENANVVFCVDFGLSKRYRHPKTLQHIPHRDGRSLTGTPRYASINNHLGIEQSRRDDLESIAYVLIYFLKGTLPWQGLKAKNAQKKYRLILEKKQQVSIAQLCAGCPSQFGEFLAYTRALKFDTKPDIPFLRKMFRDLYHAQGYANQSGKVWDWDSAEIDAMVGGGSPPPELNTSAAPINASQGLSGAVDDDIGDQLDYDGHGINDGRNMSKRPGGTPGQSSNPAISSRWGTAGQGLVSPDQVPGIMRGENNMGEEKMPTTRSAGSLQRDGNGNLINNSNGNDDQMKRPHTASAAGRGVQTQEDDHVVAGARAMMQYRRTRESSNPQPNAVAPSPQLQQQQYQNQNTNSSGNRWANTGPQIAQANNVTSARNPPPRVTSALAASGGNATTTIRKTPSTPTTNNPPNGWQDSQGRPKSANGLPIATNDRPNSGGVRGTTPQVQPQSQPSNTASVQPIQSNTSNNSSSNPMSYGSLKNRFLSGSKTKSTKLFGLSR